MENNEMIVDIANQFNTENLANKVMDNNVEETNTENGMMSEEMLSAITGSITPSQLKYLRRAKPRIKDYKVQRNDPCPCGSGKKYKHCCLESGTYETYSIKDKNVED